MVEDPLDRHVGVLVDAAGLLEKLLDLGQAVEPSRIAAHDLAREVAAAGRGAGVRRGGAEPEREERRAQHHRRAKLFSARRRRRRIVGHASRLHSASFTRVGRRRLALAWRRAGDRHGLCEECDASPSPASLWPPPRSPGSRCDGAGDASRGGRRRRRATGSKQSAGVSSALCRPPGRTRLVASVSPSILGWNRS